MYRENSRTRKSHKEYNPGQSHPIESDRNSSESLVSDFHRKLSDVRKCRNLRIPIGCRTYRYPTTSGRNPIPSIPTTSDEFLSDPTVGLLVQGSLCRDISKIHYFCWNFSAEFNQIRFSTLNLKLCSYTTAFWIRLYKRFHILLT